MAVLNGMSCQSPLGIEGRTRIWVTAKFATRTPPTLGHSSIEASAIAVEAPICVKRRGVETKLVITSGVAKDASPDMSLVKLIAQAHEWFGEVAAGNAGSVRDVARRHGIDEGDVSRFLPLAFLAPDIVEATLSGKHPVGLTAQKLKRIGPLPMAWADQRKMVGFST